MAEEKIRVKLKFTKHQAKLLGIIIGLFALGAVTYLAYSTYFKPIYTIDFGGLPLGFRGDLRAAQKIQVVPDEATLFSNIVKPQLFSKSGSFIFTREPLKNVTIVFKPVSKETMGWYSVEAAEIVNKLTLVYKASFGLNLTFNAVPVDSYDSLNGTSTDVVIALVHPEIANDTFVKVDPDKHLITISGAKSLTNFDLATVKFLMVALGIKV